MEGTHRKVGSRPFMPDPTLTCLCSALLGHIAKLGSITHPKQRRARIVDWPLFVSFQTLVSSRLRLMSHVQPRFDFRNRFVAEAQGSRLF